MLERIAGNGVRTIIVETANRFARDLMVQEVGYAHLREQGIELVAADSPHSFVDDTPTAPRAPGPRSHRRVRQSDDRRQAEGKSAEAGRRIEGRKGLSITHPEAVSLRRGVSA